MAVVVSACVQSPKRVQLNVAPPTVAINPPIVRAVAQNQFVLAPQQTVVGEVQVVVAREGDTLPDLARRFNLGYEEIIRANPTLPTWRPGVGREVVLPTRFVLPDAPHEGVVIDVASMRLFYYPAHGAHEPARVVTYPIGIGKLGWKTPEGLTKVTAKVKDPVWTPPLSVRKEHEEEDNPLPARVPPGPDNPLGAYLFRLGWPSYLIHGTNKPYGVGMRASHGCVRLYPEDIAALFVALSVDTKVRVVNQPYRFGFSGNQIEFQAVEPLEDDRRSWKAGPKRLLDQAKKNPSLTRLVAAESRIDWQAVDNAAGLHVGVPVTVLKGSAQSLSQTVERAKRVDNDLPLGSNWNGVMDLSDDEQMFRSLLMERAKASEGSP
jgi:L,D-transpeptidase ErfK/SrfK